MSLRPLVAFSLLLAGCLHGRSGGPPPAEFAVIEDLEDRRALSDGQLDGWARQAANPRVRARAVLALGRVQDEASAPTVIAALADLEPEVRLEAAFSTGLLGLSWQPLGGQTIAQLTAGVLKAEPDESDPQVRQAMLKALGQLATPAAVERLIERLKSPLTRATAAMALGLAAKHEAKLPARALWALTPLLKPELDVATRYGAAYGLAQSKDPAAMAGLSAGLQDPSPETRALCARGLGEVGTELSAAALKKLLDDPDWRVAVEATRALSKLALKCKGAVCAPVTALGSLSARVDLLLAGDVAAGGQPLLALAQQGPGPQGRALLVSLRERLDAQAATAVAPQGRADVANLDCRLAAAVDRLDGELKQVLRCGGGLVPEPHRLWLGLSELARDEPSDPAVRAQAIGPYLKYPHARVQLAALEVLGATRVPALAEQIWPLLKGEDLVVAGAAAIALARLHDLASLPEIRELATRVKDRDDLAITVADALQTMGSTDAAPELTAWLGSPHTAVRLAAAAALSKLTGTKVIAPRVERPAEPALPSRVALADEQGLLLRTAKGEVQIELFTQDAALNALNLVTLARRGYFKGLTFHRVVGDFVVQGGDPRGDGEGGPGYTVRCEVNRHPYTRGTVGLALSGKDTAGSQFFITHTATPHLDGRYTVVGQVTKGLDVVDRLLEGDQIIDVVAQP